MGRLTAYPFGSSFKYQGLALTGFWNYGWGDTTPDNQGGTEILKGNRAQFQRIAAMVRLGFTAPLRGMNEESTTYKLSTSWARQWRFKTLVPGRRQSGRFRTDVHNSFLAGAICGRCARGARHGKRPRIALGHGAADPP